MQGKDFKGFLNEIQTYLRKGLQRKTRTSTS